MNECTLRIIAKGQRRQVTLLVDGKPFAVSGFDEFESHEEEVQKAINAVESLLPKPKTKSSIVKPGGM